MEENIGFIGDEQGRKDVQGREDKVSVVDSCSLQVVILLFSRTSFSKSGITLSILGMLVIN